MMKKWEHLKIPFEKIDVATEKFKTCIGGGGYGSVYKGVLSIHGKDTSVAVKRLNEQFGQGLKEFLTEIQLLSYQKHQNLICLLGYCNEGKEKIIVYEYAAHGSLDRYIRRHNRDESSTTLTWLERLKICADAARGVDYLHNRLGGHRMIIHRDIKSSNILLDENWIAKIADLGLSKLGVTGLEMSDIVTNGCGTRGYCEPEYYTTSVVNKKSDVYSFGIVLFEVLCGSLCLTKSDNGFILSEESVKEYYNKGNLVKIVDPSLREHMGSYSMTKFSGIAYRCLDNDREQRPAIDIVVKELEETQVVHELEQKRKHQVLDKNEEEYWEKRLPNDYQRYIEMSNNIHFKFYTKKELYLLFCHGFLANNPYGGELWFSMCKSTRGICTILPSRHVFKHRYDTLHLPESRFNSVTPLGARSFYEFTCRLESFMFSPHYNYACYVVFKFKDGQSNDGPILRAECNLGGIDISLRTGSSKSIYGGRFGWLQLDHFGEGTGSSRSWVEKRDDGWFEARLTRPLFKHHLKNGEELRVYLNVMDTWRDNGIIVEGVEFRPVIVENSTNHLHGTSDHDENEEDKDEYSEKKFESRCTCIGWVFQKSKISKC